MSKSSIVRESVETIDRERTDTWWRPGIPGTRVKGARQPAEIIRAKARRRTARWRAENDAAKRPESAVIAAALLRALVSTPSLGQLTTHERGIVEVALLDLQGQGYSLSQVLAVCKRIRRAALDEDAKPGA